MLFKAYFYQACLNQVGNFHYKWGNVGCVPLQKQVLALLLLQLCCSESIDNRCKVEYIKDISQINLVIPSDVIHI